MTTRTIISRQNDSIDSISYRYYGYSAVEAILQANPGLARADVILPIGTAVILPIIQQQKKHKQTIQLWD